MMDVGGMRGAFVIKISVGSANFLKSYQLEPRSCVAFVC